MIVLDRSSGEVIAESVTGAAFSLNHVNALEYEGVRRWSSVVKPSWSDGDCRTVARVSPGGESGDSGGCRNGSPPTSAT